MTVPAPIVLHVAQPTEGGVAGYMAAASADQQARGWCVVAASPGGGRLARELAARRVPHLRWPATRSPGPRSWDEARRLHQSVERVRPDVVHLHSSKAGLAGRLAVRGRLPTLFQPHGWSWLAVEGVRADAAICWERAAMAWTDLVVCVGDGEAAEGRFRRLRGRFEVVRNGVDLRRFSPADGKARQTARAALAIPPDVALAVCVGRVTRQKGQDVLIDAWRRVDAHCRGAHRSEVQLAVVGAGDLLTAVRSRAPDGVRFVPPADDVRPWYAAADVVVVPSRWEGLSLTALEALACGRPVVASDIAGLTEIITGGVGALVPAENASDLAGAVALRLCRPGVARAEGMAAARLAAENFDARRTFDHLASVTARAATGWRERADDQTLPVTQRDPNHREQLQRSRYRRYAATATHRYRKPAGGQAPYP